MRAVVQRVTRAKVMVERREISTIEKGLLTLLGIEKGDNQETLEKMILKILHLRIFEDEKGKMNLSLKDIGGEHLIVSQFTLAANLQKGHRPSFEKAAEPEFAKKLYEYAIEFSKSLNCSTYGGEFGAMMKVDLINSGPATFVIDL